VKGSTIKRSSSHLRVGERGNSSSRHRWREGKDIVHVGRGVVEVTFEAIWVRGCRKKKSERLHMSGGKKGKRGRGSREPDRNIGKRK